MQYTIRQSPEPLGEPTAEVTRPLWRGAEVAEITHYQRDDSGHRPPTAARLLYDENFLAVAFRVQDQYVRAVARNFNDPVCLDSCVEFFVSPYADPTQDPYFNLETNCGGTMLLYRCPSTAETAAGTERGHLDADDAALLRVVATLPKIVDPEQVGPTDWSIEVHLPWGLFQKHFGVERPGPGTVWRGNFYKCGDRTSHPHWGAWAPLSAMERGFHRPMDFQPLHFV